MPNAQGAAFSDGAVRNAVVEASPPYVRRDRFKTLGRALGASDRILDAILGHPGKTVSDGYGDLTVSAKRRVIDSLPDYDLSDKSTGATRVT